MTITAKIPSRAFEGVIALESYIVHKDQRVVKRYAPVKIDKLCCET